MLKPCFTPPRSAAFWLCTISSLTALSTSSAAAQDARKHLTLLGIPSATVSPAGTGYVALSFTNDRTGAATGSDASISMGLGFGDADRSIGFQLGAEITSTKSDFGDSGYLTAKFSKRISTETPLYVGLVVDQLVPWGDSKALDPAASLSVTHFTSAGNNPIMWTLGAGTDIRNGGTDPGLFAGVGVGLSTQIAASAAYDGDEAIFGISWAPSPSFNFSATLDDAFNERNNRRGILNAVWVFNSRLGG